MKNAFFKFSLISFVILFVFISTAAYCQDDQTARDAKVRAFLEENKSKWHDLNVPYEDGQVLYDLIIKNKYTSALEIGTSTGHSTIWIAWALSKTGGKLITVEINENRHKKAIENLKTVGLLSYVDTRLADAHEEVKKLNTPIDFVFSDADKDWYIQYFKDVQSMLAVGGCFTAHNVRNNFSGIREFLEYIRQQKSYETTIEGSDDSGISVSYRKK